jgi:hypothetical protein
MKATSKKKGETNQGLSLPTGNARRSELTDPWPNLRFKYNTTSLRFQGFCYYRSKGTKSILELTSAIRDFTAVYSSANPQ